MLVLLAGVAALLKYASDQGWLNLPIELRLAGVTVAFCLLSLGVGYGVPRLLKIERPQAVASAFEVGLHNATLAIVIAQSVLNSPEMPLPGAVYGVLMFPLAAAFGILITRRKTEAA